MSSQAGVLDTKVLVLNRLYAAVRVIDAYRAFTLLAKEAAEVISVEGGSWVGYSFDSWAQAAEYQRRYEHESHDWVQTTRIV
ncbi:MAG: CRISPR-associated endonuclease Cas9, partial [Planctomycetota bacterium]